MEQFNSFTDIWSYYDDVERKKFMAHDIVSALNSIPKDNPEAEKCRYEAMAFDFAENCDGKEWGTYYGPTWTMARKDTGEEVYVPDIKDVTQEMLEYWEQRSGEVKNPLLKMRYTGLVLEFKKKLFGKEPDYKSIKIGYLQALLDVIEGDYCEYEIIAFDYAERALSLSVKFRNQDYEKKVVRAYYDAHKRWSGDDMHPGVWGRIFQSLIKHRESFATYEKELLQEQMERFDRLYHQAIEEGGKTDKYVHVLKDQADLLSDYYHLTGDPGEIEPLLDKVLEAIKVSVAARGGMWGQGMIQQLQERYRKYGFDRKANQLFVDLGDLGDATLSELKSTELTIPIDRKRIDTFLEGALEGSDRDVLLYFAIYYIPRLEEERNRLKEKATRSPMLDLVSTVTIDSSGNMISRVGVGKDAERQKLYFSMYENMRFMIPFMHLHITRMKEEKKMTTESLMALLNDLPLITNDHREIVRRGFEAYMAEDYLVCCHLLVPQLEAAIRRLFAFNGANIMRTKRNPEEGNEYASLDTLLSSDEAVTYMGEDMANYFRNLLTDQYGWNIRNQVSHGLLGADNFNFGMADRVVHAFTLLGLFSKKKVEG